MTNEWTFGFQPNIWGDPNDPPFHPIFSRSEVIDDCTFITIISAYDLMDISPENWYEHFETVWQNSLKEQHVAAA